MSTNIKTSSVKVEPFPLDKIKSQVSSELLETFDLSAYRDADITVDKTDITEINSEGVTIKGVVRIGYRGKPIKDSYLFVKRVTDMLQHESCMTEPTEGKPVWFDTAAWCNYCEKLYNADDKYIGEIVCDGCNGTFPRNGVMRATLPEKVQFEEQYEFDTPANSIEEAVQSVEKVLQ
jgi:hypothetical protein